MLINQTHTDRDLIAPIDAREKRMFDAIDGTRTIGQIVESLGPTTQAPAQSGPARTFFERLWWYDQMVFDASRPSSL